MFAYRLPTSDLSAVRGHEDLLDQDGEHGASILSDESKRTVFCWGEQSGELWRESEYGEYALQLNNGTSNKALRKPKPGWAISRPLRIAGQEWDIPVAQHVKDGRAGRLYRLVEPFLIGLIKSGEHDIPSSNAFQIACGALTLGYRITDEIVSLLDLLGDEEIEAILRIVLDVDLIEELRANPAACRCSADIEHAIWRLDPRSRPARPYDIYRLAFRL